MGTQLADKTLGIVGLGRIGQAVAQACAGVANAVLGYDPFLSPSRRRSWASSWSTVARDAAAGRLPHRPHAAHRRNDEPDRRGGARIAEARRAADQLRPRRHLRRSGAGRRAEERADLGGVALDVFDEEPCTTSPLFGMPGVLCTPHLGASTEEAQTQVAVEGVELLVDYLTTGRNPPRGEHGGARSARRSQRCAGIWTWPIGWGSCWRSGIRGAPKSCRLHVSRRSGGQGHEAAHRRLRGRPAGGGRRETSTSSTPSAAARARHRAGHGKAHARWARSARR